MKFLEWLWIWFFIIMIAIIYFNQVDMSLRPNYYVMLDCETQYVAWYTYDTPMKFWNDKEAAIWEQCKILSINFLK